MQDVELLRRAYDGSTSGQDSLNPREWLLLKASIVYARAHHAKETSDDTSFKPPPAFHALTEIEKTALKEIFAAAQLQFGAGGHSPSGSPALTHLLDCFGAELVRLRKIDGRATISYARWLVLAVSAATSTINSIGNGKLTPYQKERLLRPGLLIYRKPRIPGEDIYQARSWLGGRPRMGKLPWPRDDRGIPLHFAAQLDLSEIAKLWSEADLPIDGSLAFFVGRQGAVVYVPPHDETRFTEPPAHMPPFISVGYEAPGLCPTIPFWPVGYEAMPLTADDEQAQYLEQEEFIRSRFTRRRYNITASEILDMSSRPQWWHSALLMFHDLDHSKSVGVHAAILPSFTSLHTEFQEFVAGRQLWERMEAQDVERFIVFRKRLQAVSEFHEALDKIASYGPQLPAERQPMENYDRMPLRAIIRKDYETVTLKLLLSAPPEVFASLPDTAIDKINSQYLLPPGICHQMFGRFAIKNGPAKEAVDHHMLLQLADDDLMFWSFNCGVYQFWISPKDLQVRNWSGVKLTVDC